jgi:hypothetical protein
MASQPAPASRTLQDGVACSMTLPSSHLHASHDLQLTRSQSVPVGMSPTEIIMIDVPPRPASWKRDYDLGDKDYFFGNVDTGGATPPVQEAPLIEGRPLFIKAATVDSKPPDLNKNLTSLVKALLTGYEAQIEEGKKFAESDLRIQEIDTFVRVEEETCALMKRKHSARGADTVLLRLRKQSVCMRSH